MLFVVASIVQPFRETCAEATRKDGVRGAACTDEERTIQAVTSSGTPEPRLVACPSCGAPNAASRARCACCKQDLHTDPSSSANDVVAPQAPEDSEGPSVLLVVATVIAVVAGIAVMTAILSAQGIGPFAPDVAEVLREEETADVVDVRASSELVSENGPGFSAGNVVDGDSETAWVAASEAPAWIELELGEVTDVHGVVIWNGYQAGERFGRHDRVSSLTIETDDRRFTVDLLDTRGPLSVDLPEAVPASRVRLIAEEVFSGDETAGPAFSLVEVRTRP